MKIKGFQKVLYRVFSVGVYSELEKKIPSRLYFSSTLSSFDDNPFDSKRNPTFGTYLHLRTCAFQDFKRRKFSIFLFCKIVGSDTIINTVQKKRSTDPLSLPKTPFSSSSIGFFLKKFL